MEYPERLKLFPPYRPIAVRFANWMADGGFDRTFRSVYTSISFGILALMFAGLFSVFWANGHRKPAPVISNLIDHRKDGTAAPSTIIKPHFDIQPKPAR